MTDENLKKLFEALEKDKDLETFEGIDEETKEILRKMSRGEIEVDEASEILLAMKK